jgi:hypothetical protein
MASDAAVILTHASQRCHRNVCSEEPVSYAYEIKLPLTLKMGMLANPFPDEGGLRLIS